jgi:hypothetical protein
MLGSLRLSFHRVMVAVVMMVVPATGSNYDFTFAAIVVIVMVCVLLDPHGTSRFIYSL